MQTRCGKIGDADEDVGEPGFRIDLVEATGRDHRQHNGGTVGAALAAGEGPVAPSQGDASQCALSTIVGQADPAIVEDAGEVVPAPEHVIHGLQDLGGAREGFALTQQSGVHVVEKRPALFLAHDAPLVGTAAVNGALDLEQRIEASDRLQRDRRDQARWNGALERVAELEGRTKELRANAPSTDTRTKQRLVHIVVREIVCDLDENANEAVLLIHWTGGRHTEVRVARVKTGRYPGDMAPTAVDALRKLAGHWPDRELAVSLNRMRCKTGDGETWTTVRVREMRERLSLPEYDPASCDGKMISLAKAAAHFGICVGSAKSLVLKGI